MNFNNKLFLMVLFFITVPFSANSASWSRLTRKNGAVASGAVVGLSVAGYVAYKYGLFSKASKLAKNITKKAEARFSDIKTKLADIKLDKKKIAVIAVGVATIAVALIVLLKHDASVANKSGSQPKPKHKQNQEEPSYGQEDGDECSICMEKLEVQVVNTLVCGHKFHESCIMEWFKKEDTCPNCRKSCIKA